MISAKLNKRKTCKRTFKLIEEKEERERERDFLSLLLSSKRVDKRSLGVVERALKALREQERQRGFCSKPKPLEPGLSLQRPFENDRRLSLDVDSGNKLSTPRISDRSQRVQTSCRL